MDHSLMFSKSTMVMGFFGLLVYYLLLLLLRSRILPTSSTEKNYKLMKNQKPAPEAAGAWPIIGHLHHFMGFRRHDNLIHKTLGAMADKYGPAFTIKMGFHNKALVVSSWEVAKECFTTNDMVFISRPTQVAIKHMGYGSAMFGLAPYGPYYVEMRKIVNRELLSNSRLELLKHSWSSEINTSIQELYKKVVASGSGRPVVVEMKRWFSDLTLRTTVKVICGKQYLTSSSSSDQGDDDDDDDEDEAGQFQKALRNFFRLLGQFRVSDVIPFMGWLDLVATGNYKREMKSNGRMLDSLMEECLQEHKRRKKKRLLVSSSGGADEESKKAIHDIDQDFMNVMMSILDDAKLISYYDADTINKSTCLTLILGGSDTTMVSLVWALSLLLNHPHALKKVQDELDIHVGRERQVVESDIKKLVYLQAIIKETLRLYPPGPLTAPRESSKDCTVSGYTVPAGTRLIVNTWKIQRDPRVWPDPSEFKPERFLTINKDIDVRGQNFELIPFGSGRRSCPGAGFALQVLRLTLARMVHGFEFRNPSADRPVDMTESAGITNVKSTPLEVFVTPRLPSDELYVY